VLASLWSAEIFVYGALLFYVLGFLFRDELWLRGLLFVGTIFYILYYYFAAQSPLWDAILRPTQKVGISSERWPF